MNIFFWEFHHEHSNSDEFMFENSYSVHLDNWRTSSLALVDEWTMCDEKPSFWTQRSVVKIDPKPVQNTNWIDFPNFGAEWSIYALRRYGKKLFLVYIYVYFE